MELYTERGFEQTTVAEIAQRAGLTERTFFRHFADKREVLFRGSGELRELFVTTLAACPQELPPIEAVARAVEAAAGLLGERPGWARRRQTLILAHPELQERELIKLAGLAAALATTLRERGVADPTASLTAEAAIAVFKVAFESWVAEGNERDFTDLVRDSFAELRAVAAGG